MAEENMFHRHNSDVDNGPVADDTQEGLQRVTEVDGSAAADYNRGDKSEGNEDDTGDAEHPGSKVLRVESERVVVWDVVLLG